MRRLVLPATLSVALGLAASALAALPTSGSFAGVTSARAVNGFQDIVTFNAKSGGRTLTNFDFSTEGCFGIGTIPVGVDPYAQPYTEGAIASVPVSAMGVVDDKAFPKFVETNGIKTMATIKATFTSSSKLTGTISVTQSDNGASCAAPLMRFNAIPGTPQSLGYSGP